MKPMICTSWPGRRSLSSPATTCAGFGGGGEHQRRHHTQRALGQERPGAEQAVLGQPQRTDLDPRTARDERHEQREDDERQLDDHPPREVAERHPRQALGPSDEEEVDGVRGEGGAGGEDDGQDEGDEREQLDVGGEPVDGGVPVEVEVVSVSGAHVRRRSGESSRSRSRRRTARNRPPAISEDERARPSMPASPPRDAGVVDAAGGVVGEGGAAVAGVRLGRAGKPLSPATDSRPSGWLEA